MKKVLEHITTAGTGTGATFCILNICYHDEFIKMGIAIITGVLTTVICHFLFRYQKTKTLKK